MAFLVGEGGPDGDQAVSRRAPVARRRGPVGGGAAGKGGNAIFDYISHIQEMNRPEQILQELRERLAGFGIRYFVFSTIARSTEEFRHAIFAIRMHPQWIKRFFVQRDGDDNPLLSGSIRNSEPVFWSEIELTAQNRTRLRRMFHDAASYGLTAGLCIPIYFPGRLPVVANFIGSSLRETPETRVSLHAMAMYTHYRLLHLREIGPQKNPLLTSREAGCLAWVAQGKTDWEIGEILGISENTVHWYIENSKRKLGVATRIQAVVSAIQAGMILV